MAGHKQALGMTAQNASSAAAIDKTKFFFQKKITTFLTRMPQMRFRRVIKGSQYNDEMASTKGTILRSSHFILQLKY